MAELTTAIMAWRTIQCQLDDMAHKVRDVVSEGWTLHSWNVFKTFTGGGRCGYEETLCAAALFYKETK